MSKEKLVIKVPDWDSKGDVQISRLREELKKANPEKEVFLIPKEWDVKFPGESEIKEEDLKKKEFPYFLKIREERDYGCSNIEIQCDDPHTTVTDSYLQNRNYDEEEHLTRCFGWINGPKIKKVLDSVYTDRNILIEIEKLILGEGVEVRREN